MPLIEYEQHRFGEASLDLIAKTRLIAAEYAAQGFTLTLRQIYYQMVSRGWIENNQRSYSRMGDVVSLGRMAGKIDWLTVIDRTRNLISNNHWPSPERIVADCARQFAFDKWSDQRCRVEVWVEKQALEDVLRHACAPLDVAYIACKGYMSQSEMWAAGRRLLDYLDDGQDVVIIHLGDHDPSGMDMSRDVADRLSVFCEQPVEVRRVALNMDQVIALNPPPNPAKLTDSRAAAYIQEYGMSSWELDAIEPTNLSDLITERVLEYRDEDLWDAQVEREEDARATLSKIARQWGDVVESLA